MLLLSWRQPPPPYPLPSCQVTLPQGGTEGERTDSSPTPQRPGIQSLFSSHTKAMGSGARVAAGFPVNGPNSARLFRFLGSGSDRSAACCVSPSWLAAEREDNVRQALLLACLQRYNWKRGPSAEDAPNFDRFKEVLSGLGTWLQQVLASPTARHPPTDNRRAWELAAESLRTQETLVFYPLVPPRLEELREGEESNEAAARYWTAVRDAVRRFEPGPQAAAGEEQGGATVLAVALAAPLGEGSAREVVTLTSASARRFPSQCQAADGLVRRITALYLRGFPLALGAPAGGSGHGFVLAEQNTLRKLRLSQMEVTGKGSMLFRRCGALEEFVLTRRTAGEGPAMTELVFQQCPQLRVIDTSTGSSGPQPVSITLWEQEGRIVLKPGAGDLALTAQPSCTFWSLDLDGPLVGGNALLKLENGAPLKGFAWHGLQVVQKSFLLTVKRAIDWGPDSHGVENEYTVELPALETCGEDLTLMLLGCQHLREFALPELRQVGRNLTLELTHCFHLEAFKLPQLAFVHGCLALTLDARTSLWFTGMWPRKQSEIELPLLRTCWSASFRFYAASRLDGFRVPELSRTEGPVDVEIKGCKELSQVALPKLASASRVKVVVTHSARLQELVLPALQTADKTKLVLVQCEVLNKVSLPRLSTTATEAKDAGPQLRVTIRDCGLVQKLEAPALETAGLINIEIDGDALPLVDLSGLRECKQDLTLTYVGPSQSQQDPPAPELAFTNVSNVGGLAKFDFKRGHGLRILQWPKLAKANRLKLACTDCKQLEKALLPTLSLAPELLALGFLECPEFEELSVPLLKTAAYDTYIWLRGCNRATELCFPDLKEQQQRAPTEEREERDVEPRLEICIKSCEVLNTLDLPALQTTSTPLTIEITNCQSFTSCLLPSLTACPAVTVNIKKCEALQSFRAPPLSSRLEGKVAFEFIDCKNFSMLTLPDRLTAGELGLSLQKCPQLLEVRLPTQLECGRVDLVLSEFKSSFRAHFPAEWLVQTQGAQKELGLYFVACSESVIRANIPKSLAVQKLCLSVIDCAGLQELELPPWAASCTELELTVTNCAAIESIVFPAGGDRTQVRIKLWLEDCPLLRQLKNEPLPPMRYALLSVINCPCLKKQP